MKFSIITVCYNAAGTIETTLQSVAGQTYKDIEYIIIDGASKDDTLDIVRRYNGIVTKVISEPDKGIYDAMNKGIALATGQYLCFLNAGDRFHSPHTLAAMAESVPDGNGYPDVMYGETNLMDAEGNDLGPRRFRAPEQLTWKSFKNGMMVCHQAFFASAVMAKSHLYDLQYRYSADQDWCIRIMKDSHWLHNTHTIIIDYLNEGTTTRNRMASLKERFNIMARHYGLAGTVARHIWFVLRLPFV